MHPSFVTKLGELVPSFPVYLLFLLLCSWKAKCVFWYESLERLSPSSVKCSWMQAGKFVPASVCTKCTVWFWKGWSGCGRGEAVHCLSGSDVACVCLEVRMLMMLLVRPVLLSTNDWRRHLKCCLNVTAFFLIWLSFGVRMWYVKALVSLFSDAPSQTQVLQHDDVGDSPPVKQHAYRVNPDKRLGLPKQVDYMLENGITEPSCSSCLLCDKSDGSDYGCTIAI